MTVEIEPSRLMDITNELQNLATRKYTTRNELESLIGKLQFISNCVKSARVFITRMLDNLKQMPRLGKH